MPAVMHVTQHAQPGPRERLVPYYLLAVMVIACGGIPKGTLVLQ